MSESNESPDPSQTVTLGSVGIGLRNRRVAFIAAGMVAVLAIAGAAFALWPSPAGNEASPGPDRTTASANPSRTRSPSAGPSPSASESASPTAPAYVSTGGATGAWTPPAPGGEYVAEFPPPAAPTLLSVEALNGTTVRVRWADNSHNETKFSVLSWPSIKIVDVPANATQHDFGGLTPETEHCFAVAAFNGPRRSPEAIPYPGPLWSCVRTLPSGPPAAPSNLTARSWAGNGTTTMHLQWTDNSHNETRFVLDVGERPGGVRFPSAYSNEYYVYAATTIEEFVEYCFLVKAENSVGSSAWSNQACVTPLPAPAAPTNLTATAIGPDTIRLTWTDNSNVEEQFVIHLQNTVSARYPPANSTSWDWTGLAPATQYCFRVQARNASWTSGGAPGGATYLCATTLA